MLSKMFTIYDSKSESYLRPFYCSQKGEAIRLFADEAKNPQSGIGKHPEDYTLFEIGTYDDSDASVVMLDAKISLGLALEYSSKEKLTGEEQLSILK